VVRHLNVSREAGAALMWAISLRSVANSLAR
jgi:hypothetical protein